MIGELSALLLCPIDAQANTSGCDTDETVILAHRNSLRLDGVAYWITGDYSRSAIGAALGKSQLVQPPQLAKQNKN
jgi:hypothetical protein